MNAHRHDRGFSIIEAMIASVVMLIGLLGFAGLQVVGMRANNLGKRMSQGSLLAQDLVNNMQMWSFTDARLTPVNHTSTYTDTNHADISQYWDTGRGVSPSVKFDYTDGPDTAGATNVNQLATNYEGVLSPVDTTLAAGEQTIFQRYWNAFSCDPGSLGSATGKLVQVVVRWKEPNLGYRQVTASFFKTDMSKFNQ